MDVTSLGIEYVNTDSLYTRQYNHIVRRKKRKWSKETVSVLSILVI